MTTPTIAGIRISYSEDPALHPGQQFDTIAQFDATLRAASAAAATDCGPFKVGYVVAWSDGTFFASQMERRRPEYPGLVNHVIACCIAIERASPTAPLPSARATFARIRQAAAEERAAQDRAHADELERAAADIRRDLVNRSFN
jgi:hypothetical protein